MHRLEQYVDRVCAGLNLPAETQALIREELLAHAGDAVRDKLQAGADEQQAIAETLHETGHVDEIRDQYRAAYLKEHIRRLTGHLLGLAAFFVLLVMVCMLGGSLGIFLNSTALLLVLGGSTVLLLGIYSPRNLFGTIAAPFRLAVDESRFGLATAAHVLRTWAVLCAGCGILAATLGTAVACLKSDTPESIGPALALAMTGLIYGLMLASTFWTIAGSLPRTEITATTRGSRGIGSIIAMTLFVAILLFAADSIGIGWHDLFCFVDIPSIVFVMLGVAALSVATHGFRGTWKLLRAVFMPSRAYLAFDRDVRMLGMYCLAVGLIGFLIGGVLTLAHLSDLSTVPRATAVALLTLLYGIILGLLCWAMSRSPLEHDSIRCTQIVAPS